MKSLQVLCCTVLLMVFAVTSRGQEEYQVVNAGKTYIDINVRSLDRYCARMERQQKLFLNRLKKREHRFANQLKKKDSAAYARYCSQPLNYDSIGRVLKSGSNTIAVKANATTSAIIDSLKGVQSFIQSAAFIAGINSPELNQYSSKFSELQQKLAYQETISEMIVKRAIELKRIGGKENVTAFAGIDRQASIYKGRIAAWKEIAGDPSRTEEKALEFLSGTKGFDEVLNKSTADPNSMQAGMSTDELSALGFQVKSSVNKALKEKAGGTLGKAQEQLSNQINTWQHQYQSISGEVGQAKQTLKQLQANRPSFKINPLRGKPFILRLEKQYDFQVSKATDIRPAIIAISAGISYKQTNSFSYGLNGICDFGLGQNWAKVHFSFQGVGWRAYCRLVWQYGIGGYFAYERTWKQNVFTGNTTTDPQFQPSAHNTRTYTESIFLGLEKQYRINKELNGSVQLLYDFYWKEKGMASPFQIRFSTIK